MAGRAGALYGRPCRAEPLTTLRRPPPVPVDRPAKALGQRNTRMPSEELFRAGDVQLPPRLAVWLRGVPSDAAAESGFPGDEAREIPDRDLLARSEVHGRRAVVPLRGRENPLGRVLHIKKLARRRAIAPEDDLARA